MKKVFKKLCCLVLIIPFIFLSGCLFDASAIGDLFGNDNEDSYTINEIDGFKVCYKPDEYNFQNLFENYSYEIMVELYNYFGLPYNADVTPSSVPLITRTSITSLTNLHNSYTNSSEPTFDTDLTLATKATEYDRINHQTNYSLCTDSGDPNFNKYIISESSNSSWKWNFKILEENVSDNDLPTPTVESILAYDLFDFYYFYDFSSFYGELFGNMLQIAIYEILMGQTPTTWQYSGLTSGYYTYTANSSNKNLYISTDFNTESLIKHYSLDEIYIGSIGTELYDENSYLTELKEDYSAFGTYVGISEQDKTSIYNYILNNVVGTDIINDSNFNPTINVGGNNVGEYQYVVDQVLSGINMVEVNMSFLEYMEEYYSSLFENVSLADMWEDFKAHPLQTYVKLLAATSLYGISSELVSQIATIYEEYTSYNRDINIYDCYPASGVKDFEGADFFTGSNNNSLDHISSYEYQSMVVLVNDTNSTSNFISLWLAFESEMNMQIAVKVRYFNSETNNFAIVSEKTVEITAGTWDPNNIVSMDFDPNVNIGAFDCEQLEDSGSGLSTQTVQEYYTIQDSQSGYGAIGVLDSSVMDCSYMEISYDIIKNSSQQYSQMPFKVGVVWLWTGN